MFAIVGMLGNILNLYTINFIYESGTVLRNLEWGEPLFGWMVISGCLTLYIFYITSIHNKRLNNFRITRKALASTILIQKSSIDRHKESLQKAEADKLEIANKLYDRIIEVEKMFDEFRKSIAIPNEEAKIEWIRELILKDYPAEKLSNNLNKSQLLYKLNKLRETKEEFEA